MPLYAPKEGTASAGSTLFHSGIHLVVAGNSKGSVVVLGYKPTYQGESEASGGAGRVGCDKKEAALDLGPEVYCKKRKREHKRKGSNRKDKSKRLPSKSSFFPKLADVAKLGGVESPVLCTVAFRCARRLRVFTASHKQLGALPELTK